jgi:kinetochore protein Spc7/SPC105
MTLDSFRQMGDEIIPVLKEQYEDIKRELEKEEAEVAEIDASDQTYLDELKASIADQK